MLVMPLQIGRHRSLSPQPHHRNEYQHSPHPPNHPMKPQQLRASNRGPEVCGKALGSYVAGVSPPRLNSGIDAGTTRLPSREESVLDAANVQNRQLALKLGEIDRESQRLLKTRQREVAEVRRFRKDIHKHSVYDNSPVLGRGTPDHSDRLSDVLSHSPINLNLPRVSSRQNSPTQSPARTRKVKVGKKPDNVSNATKQIKVVVKDYSQDAKFIPEPQRTSSDSDLRENNRLLSPGVRKRSMSATSLFPMSSISNDFMLPEATSRSAASSPQHAPTIHIEQCFDDLALHSHVANMSEVSVDRYEGVEDNDSPGRSHRGKAIWELDSRHVRRAMSPNEIRNSQVVCFASSNLCKQRHDHHRFRAPTLRSAKSESNITMIQDSSISDPRFKRLTSVLVPKSHATSSDDVSDCETGDTLSSSQTSSPSSSFLQLPSLKISEGPYDESLSRLCRSSETPELRSPTPERRVSPPSCTSQVPTLPEVTSRSPSTSPRMSPRAPPGPSMRRGSNHSKPEGAIGCTFLAPGQNEIVSPPMTPVLSFSDCKGI